MSETFPILSLRCDPRTPILSNLGFKAAVFCRLYG